MQADPVTSPEEATDTLLVYFAGHGMRDADSTDLYLALGDSREHLGYTAVAYQHLRTALRTARARRKIVVLDCCFSGRAARALSAGQLAAQARRGRGHYVPAASPRTPHSLAGTDGESLHGHRLNRSVPALDGVEAAPKLD
ncbi:caspase family protein [Streptomyces sp. DHE17-7]|uniref:caspase family protein n=1 Tax=Streptomyces sp. DHE17-7 TaxID=2759949 RepID=UPI002FCDE707|nr:hypothetical protein [Streptomyces sp. DHE17-7]